MGNAGRAFQLPIINLAPYWNGRSANETERQVVSKALHSACVEYGFFYLDISHYVDPAETEELIRLAREFFGLPQAEKDKIALSHQDFARGTGAMLPSVDKDKVRLRPQVTKDSRKTLRMARQTITRVSTSTDL